jgi:hypothetical protein
MSEHFANTIIWVSVYQYLKLSDDFSGLLVEQDDPVLALHEHSATRTSEE